MSYINQLLTVQRAAVRCGVQDKSLNQKRFAIKDAIAFGEQIQNEIEHNRQMLQLVEIAAALTWTIVIMTDIIQDAVKVEPTGRAKVVMFLLDKVRDKTAGSKFDGNRYNRELDGIDKMVEALKLAAPGGEDVINVFGNLAKNSLGLTDAIQSSAENKLSSDSQRRQMATSLQRLLKQLREVEAKMRDDALSDDGAGEARRMSFGVSATAKQRMP